MRQVAPNPELLPIFERRVRSAGGVAVEHYVDCPRTGRVLAVSRCGACGDRLGPRSEPDGRTPRVECRAAGACPAGGLAQLMTRQTECVTADLPAARAAHHRGLRSITVVDEAGRPLGTVDADALDDANPSALVADLMQGAASVLSDLDTVSEAADRLVAEGRAELPVVSTEGALVGVVSALDLLGALRRQAAAPAAPAPRPDADDALDGAGVVVLSGDPALLDVVPRLGELGARASSAPDLAAGLAEVRREAPLVVVIDGRLPGLQLAELLRRLKNMAGAEASGILVVGGGEEVDRLLAFELGVDEYLTDVPGARELALRVRALARRVTTTLRASTPRSEPGGAPEWRGLRLDPTRQRAFADGQPLSLRRMELRVLSLLMEHPGKVLSRSQLRSALWPEDDTEVSPRTIDTHVRRLRAALGAYQDAIETVHGAGYRLREP